MASEPTWRIQLLGILKAACRGQPLLRFETRQAAVLLARLALVPRAHPREELMELLWPDEDPDATRTRLRQVLTTLRRTLSSFGPEEAEVLRADRTVVQLDPRLVTTDVGEMEAALRTATRTTSLAERADLFRQAAELYTGELLPGFYEEWVLAERERLAAVHSQTLVHLADALRETGNLTEALVYARRAVAADPLREESQALLLHLYIAAGQPVEAVRQFRELERTLWRELRAVPPDGIRTLIEPFLTGAPPAAVPLRVSSGPEPRPTTEGNSSGMEEITAQIVVPLSPFFGRDGELEALVSLLSPSASTLRLVTLTGPGGTGKTRLAIEAARLLMDVFQNRVAWVPLVDVSEAAHIPNAVADALRPNRTPVPDPIGQVALFVAGKPTLIVLDNFEHLADEGAGRLRVLLERVPSLTCLVTSRQRLEIVGEQEYAIDPLPTPPEAVGAERMTPEQALTYSSVQLFVDRAGKAASDFRLLPENAATVAALCGRLEGIPLAVELAAGWASILSPEQILSRLSDRFRLLVRRQAGSEERHRSLLSTLEWSVERLAPELQRFLARLSLFRGGWTLEAAEAIAEEPETPGVALDFLARLRQHSLIVTEGAGRTRRFRMLETIREHADRLLPDEARASLAQRHATFFVEFAERAGQELTGPDLAPWMELLDAEYENIRSALAWCQSSPVQDIEATSLGLRFLPALRRYWELRSLYAEADRWIEPLLAKSAGVAPQVRAAALLGVGAFYGNRVMLKQSIAYLEESLAVYTAEGDPVNVAWTQYWLGSVLRDNLEFDRARVLLDESIVTMEAHREALGIANAQAGRGYLACMEGDFIVALSLLEEAAARCRIVGHRRAVAWCLGSLGHTELKRGNLDRAASFYREATVLAQGMNDGYYLRVFQAHLSDIAYATRDTVGLIALLTQTIAACEADGAGEVQVITLLRKGDAHRQLDDPTAARESYHTALRLAVRIHSDPAIASALRRLGDFTWEQGEAHPATLLVSAAQVWEVRVKEPLEWAGKEEFPPVVPETLQAALGEDNFQSAWLRGRLMTFDELLALTHIVPDTLTIL